MNDSIGASPADEHAELVRAVSEQFVARDHGPRASVFEPSTRSHHSPRVRSATAPAEFEAAQPERPVVGVRRTRWYACRDAVSVCDRATGHASLPVAVTYASWDRTTRTDGNATRPLPATRRGVLREQKAPRDWDRGVLKAHVMNVAPFPRHHRSDEVPAAPFGDVRTGSFAAALSPTTRAAFDPQRTGAFRLPDEPASPTVLPLEGESFSRLLPAAAGSRGPGSRSAEGPDGEQTRQVPTRSEQGHVPLHTRVARTFTDTIGTCRLRLAGDTLPGALVGQVVEELRRATDAPTATDVPADIAVHTVDFSDCYVPRLDAETGRPVLADANGAAPDPTTTVHPLVSCLDRIFCPGDPQHRAHRPTTLLLDRCFVQDPDAELLGQMLRSPACTVTALSLSGNYLSPNGADAIKKAIKYNTKLRKIELGGNAFMDNPEFEPSGEEVLRVIAERLNNNARGTSNLSAVKRLLG